MVHPAEERIDAEGALARLLDGNNRFSACRPTYRNQTPERREALREGQHPFAVIIGCADSRVPPELIFDQGLGDLFVIRTAGHVMGRAILGSIEYAVLHLHVPLILVLGHSDCGAVKATLSSDIEPKGHLQHIRAGIEPALYSVDSKAYDAITVAGKTHAILVAEDLRSSNPMFSEAVKDGSLKIYAAFYCLETGKVEILF